MLHDLEFYVKSRKEITLPVKKKLEHVKDFKPYSLPSN